MEEEEHAGRIVVHASGVMVAVKFQFSAWFSVSMSRSLKLALFTALAVSTLHGPAEAKAGSHHATSLAAHLPTKGMVAAANPLAVEAGLNVLRRGGSAVDAAVAVQAALGLVEPQSSGLGGGAFMTYYDAKTRKVLAFNGREKAPMGASPDMFMGPDGKPLPFVTAVVSGRATGVPGAIAMLHMAQGKYGKLPWSTLFVDAERLADQALSSAPAWP